MCVWSYMLYSDVRYCCSDMSMVIHQCTRVSHTEVEARPSHMKVETRLKLMKVQTCLTPIRGVSECSSHEGQSICSTHEVCKQVLSYTECHRCIYIARWGPACTCFLPPFPPSHPSGSPLSTFTFPPTPSLPLPYLLSCVQWIRTLDLALWHDPGPVSHAPIVSTKDEFLLL